MTSNVVAIAPTINQDAVQIAQDLLDGCLSGDIVALAAVAVHRGGDVANAYSKSDRYHQLNSGVARLAARMAAD